jgi:2'-5' RNA ligase
LVFIGETERAGDIIKIMDGICPAPFSLTLSRTGKFSHSRGDICWVGIKESPALSSLQSRLIKGLATAGFLTEERPYHPHITLGRGVKTDNFEDRVSELTFLVSDYTLMESTNENGKLIYKEIHTCHLSGKKDL